MRALILTLACACGTDTGMEPDPVATGPTWHQDVAPLVAQHCGTCHVDGGIAPFALTSYDDAAPIASQMLKQVMAGTMPPWGAVGECATPRKLKDDPTLTSAEIELLKAWTAAGAPAGDPATAAPIPVPPSRELPGATHTIAPIGSWTTSGTSDQFICLVYDPKLTTDMWLTGVEFRPTDKAVVHHAAAFVDPTRASEALAGPDGVYECFGGNGIPAGQPIGGYTPGALPWESIAGTGMRVPANSLIVVQMHYHPLGAQGPVRDATSLAMRMSTTKPGLTAVFAARGNEFQPPELQPDPDDRGVVEFRVPANVKGHTETMRIPMMIDPGKSYPIWSIFPHMHYVGTRMEVNVEHSDGTKDCLIDAGRYDFNWQRMYAYEGTLAEMPRVRSGDTLVLKCTYDNTLSNENVQRALKEKGLGAPVDVYGGEQTLDEMCIVAVGAAIP